MYFLRAARARSLNRAAALAALIVLTVPIARARADDPLGFYAGGAIGEAHVRGNEEFQGSPLGFDEHHSAWRLFVGLRPISLVGAELEYVNFGHPSALLSAQGALLGTQADAQVKGVAAFGVVHAPIPLPFVDVFAKAGVARIQTTVNAVVVCTGLGSCPPIAYVPPLAVNQTSTRFAYGAGVQVKVAAFGIRAEYERISMSGGDPDLLSLGIIWIF